MRRTASVDAVRAALVAALGLLGGCGGEATSGPGGRDGAEGAADGGAADGDDDAFARFPDDASDGTTNRDGTSEARGRDADVNDADDGGDASPTVDVPASCGAYSCRNPSPVIVGGVDTGYDTCAGAAGSAGYMRRRAIVTCPSFLPRASHGVCGLADASAPDGSANDGGCASDNDCAGDPSGHCEIWTPDAGVLATGCRCVHGCRNDSDCATSEVCVCADPIGQCRPASCTSGASCIAGCDCITSTKGHNCGPQFDCQTPVDECSGSGDCSQDASLSKMCTEQNGQHVCAPASYCGVGRPFLVRGRERLAACVAQSDWAPRGLALDLRGLSPAARARLSAHWTRVGLMEHASIAAFARFTLHLLAVGAPPELVLASQEAMGDETEHARLAFSIASGYRGHDVGPGPLPIDGSLDGFDVRGMVTTLLREGCIGETLAAIEAREALEGARDPVLRAVLERIARDETRHAELAWRTLRWLIAAGRVDRAWLQGEVKRALSEASPSSPAAKDEPEMRAFGIVSGARRSELRRMALSRIVGPCATAVAAAASGQRALIFSGDRKSLAC